MSTTEQVWDEFSAALRAFIRRRVPDDHVADDLLQDVFVRIHDKLDSLANDDRLAAWLYRITRNMMTDHHRRRSHVGLDSTEISSAEDTDDKNLNEQVGEWLSNLIANLPGDYREAVTLAELNGVAQTEIAERIGLSVSGTKSRVQRGRRMLKAVLLECCHFEFDQRGNVIDYEVKTDCTQCCDSENRDCGSEVVAPPTLMSDPPNES